MLPPLNEHEQKILKFIERYILRFSFPPTIGEIGRAVSIPSKDHVYRDLVSIEEKGYIERQRGISRGIKLLYTAEGYPFSPSTFHIPLLGRIAAGEPIPFPDGDSPPFGYETVEVPRLLIGRQERVFALEVKGDSMVDALIEDGDIVIMRPARSAENGEMVAAWLKDEGETTLKRFYLEGELVRLQPANPTMEPIYVHPSKLEVQGKVIAVIRKMGRVRS